MKYEMARLFLNSFFIEKCRLTLMNENSPTSGFGSFLLYGLFTFIKHQALLIVILRDIDKLRDFRKIP